MTLSEIVEFFRRKEAELGNVEIFKEETDGHSTWSAAWNPKIEFKKIWPKHPTEKRHYVS